MKAIEAMEKNGFDGLGMPRGVVESGYRPVDARP
jgi:hypothetical protein